MELFTGPQEVQLSDDGTHCEIFNLEASAAEGAVDSTAPEEDLKTLASKLADESGIGKR